MVEKERVEHQKEASDQDSEEAEVVKVEVDLEEEANIDKTIKEMILIKEGEEHIVRIEDQKEEIIMTEEIEIEEIMIDLQECNQDSINHPEGSIIEMMKDHLIEEEIKDIDDQEAPGEDLEEIEVDKEVIMAKEENIAKEGNITEIEKEDIDRVGVI